MAIQQSTGVSRDSIPNDIFQTDDAHFQQLLAEGSSIAAEVRRDNDRNDGLHTSGSEFLLRAQQLEELLRELGGATHAHHLLFADPRFRAYASHMSSRPQDPRLPKGIFGRAGGFQPCDIPVLVELLEDQPTLGDIAGGFAKATLSAVRGKVGSAINRAQIFTLDTLTPEVLRPLAGLALVVTPTIVAEDIGKLASATSKNAMDILHGIHTLLDMSGEI